MLVALGEQLRRRLRQSDVRCRLGGDEFLVILPDTSLDDALRVAESVRRAIEEIAIPTPRGKLRITASIGIAAACDEQPDVAAFVDRADVALYRAKQAGRNTVQAGASSVVRIQQARLRLAASRPA